MSNLALMLRSLISWLTPRDGAKTHPDHMSLHDWADLPPYHPVADRAPC